MPNKINGRKRKQVRLFIQRCAIESLLCLSGTDPVILQVAYVIKDFVGCQDYSFSFRKVD